jgi:hypothetical protein
MYAILPLIAWGSFLIIFWRGWSTEESTIRSLREASLVSFAAWFTCCILSTEILSLFHAVTMPTIALTWGIWIVVGLLFTWKHGWLRQTYRAVQDMIIGSKRLGGSLSQKLQIIGVLLILAVTLLIAWLAPPNTNDSLVYHMSRVMHWIQARTVNHYPTPIARQLWMAPGAEMAVLHLTLLSGSDRLANLVQWASMVGCLAGVTLIAQQLGAGFNGQILTAVFTATLPMGILQSTSSQTDFITALWVISLAYLTLQAHRRCLSRGEWLWLGTVIGAGVLTKGTFYAFALPLLVWLLISTVRTAGAMSPQLIMKFNGWLRTFTFMLVSLIVLVLLNAGTWIRNIQTYAFPLGPLDGIRYHANEIFRLDVLASNLVRNATLHLGTPYGVINGPLREAVEGFHRLIGLDVNDPRTTLEDYRIKRSRHEDYAGNPVHFFLILASMILLPRLLRSSEAQAASLYFVAWLGSIVMFAALYKWQPTGSRLQLPIFLAAAPLAGLTMEKFRPHATFQPVWFQSAITGLLFLGSFSPLFTNPSRPLLPNRDVQKTLLNTPREMMLFANAPEYERGYLSISQATLQTGCQLIGLKLDSHDPEYPFWVLLDYAVVEPGSEQRIRIEHLTPDPPPGYKPCAVICTICLDGNLPGFIPASNHYGGYILFVAKQP